MSLYRVGRTITCTVCIADGGLMGIPHMGGARFCTSIDISQHKIF